MSESFENEKTVPPFISVTVATSWTLGKLVERNKESFFTRRKYKKAIQNLNNIDLKGKRLVPSQAIIEAKYEDAAKELGDKNVDNAINNHQPLDKSSPLVKKAAYFGILLTLINREIEWHDTRYDLENNINKTMNPDLQPDLNRIKFNDLVSQYPLDVKGKNPNFLMLELDKLALQVFPSKNLNKNA